MLLLYAVAINLYALAINLYALAVCCCCKPVAVTKILRTIP